MSSIMSASMAQWRIYPDGGGHFALGSPDGRVLRHGEAVAIALGGFWIPGVIAWSHNGDYFTAYVDQTVCGLYARMHVRTCQDESGADAPLTRSPAVQTAPSGARTGGHS